MSTPLAPDDRPRIGLIGFGAIGRVIAQSLESRRDEGPRVVGVLRRSAAGPLDVTSVEDLLATGCTLVVEAAGREALIDHAVGIMNAGVDIVALSASALADRRFESAVDAAGPGRLHLTTGAIGGLDIIRAMALSGSLTSASITSTTVPEAVPEAKPAGGWGDDVVTVAHGAARDVASGFPRVTNVAATLAVVTLGLDRTEATLRVDPSATRKRHLIEAEAGSTRLEVSIDNTLSPDNVATSSVTAHAAVRSILDWDSHPVIV